MYLEGVAHWVTAWDLAMYPLSWMLHLVPHPLLHLLLIWSILREPWLTIVLLGADLLYFLS